MVNALIEKLATGTFNRVVIFGDTRKNPEPPYVVVKPETGVREGTRQFRVIVHHHVGRYDELAGYVFKELTKLLVYDECGGGKVFITDANGSYRLQPGGYTDVFTDTSDNTIVMERLFYMPFRNGGSV